VSQPSGNYAYGQSPPGAGKSGGGGGGGRYEGRGGRGEPSRGPASPPLSAEDANLLPLFRAVDKDGTFRPLRLITPMMHDYADSLGVGGE